MLTVGNAIMYVKALSKKPLAGTFPFSEFILFYFIFFKIKLNFIL